jgi:hypothetical protein
MESRDAMGGRVVRDVVLEGADREDALILGVVVVAPLEVLESVDREDRVLFDEDRVVGAPVEGRGHGVVRIAKDATSRLVELQ